MREKRTFKKCARLLPYQRQCQDCPHKNCALRNKEDWHKEKAMSSFNDDMRDRIKSSFILNPGEAM